MFKLQIDSQDKMKNDTEDGSLMLSSLSSKMRWGKFRMSASLDSKSTTFEDSLKDYESTKIGSSSRTTRSSSSASNASSEVDRWAKLAGLKN